MKVFPVACATLLLACLAVPVAAQRGGARVPNLTPENARDEKPEEGIPVTNQLVIDKCGSCHKKDDKGNLSRISWARATPEQWEEAIKRMVRLNGLTLAPQEARDIVKYLATYHGLAPEEAKPVMYMAEHRIQDEKVPGEGVRTACMTCHPMGRPLSWRRSKDDWKLLTNLHVALYAQAEAFFRRGGRGGPGAAGQPPQRQPVDEALDYLDKNAGLHTPEWAAWQARMRAPKLEGRWLVSAYIPGRGKYVGEMVVEPGSAEDEFTTRIKLQSVKDGSQISRSGLGIVYAGYSWRGRSRVTGATPAAPDDLKNEMRETLWFAPDQSHAEGRWFWGEYQEFGVDVKLERASSEPTLVGIDKFSIKAGSQAARLHLYGDNFPAQVAPADLDFGSGVKVARIVSHTPSDLVVELNVDEKAVSGKRDIALRRSVLESALAIYDKIDYIRVIPDASLARLGSETHPKGYEQFEAVGYNRGADGKSHTDDDIDLGPVDVSWSVEEFMAVYGDDDKDFVGQLSPSGFFTPASDGPNPKRKFSRNNYGDVWVVATSKTEKDKDGKALSGRSYLVVTVPTYIKWDQPEVEPNMKPTIPGARR
ncbi:MAG TPA: quinohemoprotein amine dehydrogenase subunit alpha [Bryobacteraceae bacterium]|nr:quinohemoprotein amine dehydrogenase subunit alpha [Bryobacteraceae bacterium]